MDINKSSSVLSFCVPIYLFFFNIVRLSFPRVLGLKTDRRNVISYKVNAIIFSDSGGLLVILKSRHKINRLTYEQQFHRKCRYTVVLQCTRTLYLK
jgi:hypothetical protein